MTICSGRSSLDEAAKGSLGTGPSQVPCGMPRAPALPAPRAVTAIIPLVVVIFASTTARLHYCGVRHAPSSQFLGNYS